MCIQVWITGVSNSKQANHAIVRRWYEGHDDRSPTPCIVRAKFTEERLSGRKTRLSGLCSFDLVPHVKSVNPRGLCHKRHKCAQKYTPCSPGDRLANENHSQNVCKLLTCLICRYFGIARLRALAASPRVRAFKPYTRYASGLERRAMENGPSHAYATSLWRQEFPTICCTTTNSGLACSTTRRFCVWLAGEKRNAHARSTSATKGCNLT